MYNCNQLYAQQRASLELRQNVCPDVIACTATVGVIRVQDDREHAMA